MGWTGVEWITSADGPDRSDGELDRRMYLSGTRSMGSRPVEDHTLEHEEHCQEQEELVPMSSTLKDQAVKELGYSPERSGTSSATWEDTDSKAQQFKLRCIHNTMQNAKS